MNRTNLLTVYLDVDMDKALAHYAIDLGTTKSSLIRYAISNILNGLDEADYTAWVKEQRDDRRATRREKGMRV